MTDLYLIAHKVRGEPAFDIATRLGCPHCDDQSGTEVGCHECDELGYWWIVPTSGHRAWPWWNLPLDALMHDTAESFPLIDPERTLDVVPVMPPDCPDHYATRAAPTISLTEALGIRPAPLPPIKRRF